MTTRSSVLQEYQAGLRAGSLLFQRCQTCEWIIYYPRVLCPRCASTDWRWQTSDGIGVLYAQTHIPDRTGPGRRIGIVELAEGFRAMATFGSSEGAAPRIASDVEVFTSDADPNAVPMLMYRALTK